MSWASYSHVVPGLILCETCALANLKYSLDWHKDEYDETDLLTLERAISLVERLNVADGATEDSKFAPAPINPPAGITCVDCKRVAA